MTDNICYDCGAVTNAVLRGFTAMIGERIKQLRERRSWNQSELAAHAGLTAAAVSQIEGGKRTPTTESLAKLADALDVSTDYLIGRTSDDELLDGNKDARILLRGVQELSEGDRETVKGMIELLRRKGSGGD